MELLLSLLIYFSVVCVCFGGSGGAGISLDNDEAALGGNGGGSGLGTSYTCNSSLPSAIPFLEVVRISLFSYIVDGVEGTAV